MLIDCRKIIVVLIDIGMLILTNAFFSYISINEQHSWLTVFFFFLVTFLCFDIITFKCMGYRVFSVVVIFVLLSFLFHFGQVFTNIIAPNYKYIDSNFLLNNFENVKKSLLFSLNIIQIMMIGIIGVGVLQKNDITKTRVSRIYDMKTFGWIITIICTPLRIVYIVAQIGEVQENTYVSAVASGFSGVFIQLSLFCVIGFVILLLTYSDEPQKATIIFFIEMVLLMMMMLSGGRLFSISTILILAMCYFYAVKRPTLKQWVIFFLTALILLKILTIITELRTTYNFTISKIFEALIHSDNEFLLRVFDEYGGTIYTVRNTFNEVPAYIDYHKGLSYLKSWLLVGLNFDGSLNEINQEVKYTMIFNRRYSYGGSYIGELYYNFGYFAYLFAPLIGVFAGKLSKGFEKNILNQNYYHLAFYIMPVYALFGWVRGYFDSFTRSFVWGSILIYILAQLCVKRKN